MRTGLLSTIVAAVSAAAGREQVVLDEEPVAGAVSGFELAYKAQGVYNTQPHHYGSAQAQALVEEAWNKAWLADPKRVLAKLQPKESPVNTRPPPNKISRKLGAHTVHRHHAFPNYELRLKDPGKALGIDSVQQYSGYVDILDEDKHFFFWLYESRSNPAKDPVVLWLNGGPGCSSSTGEFFELGPGLITKNLTTTPNPHSWNNEATVIFLDQPVNVGYSYSSKRVSNAVMAGEDVYAFLEVLFDALPQYSKQPFHISGESYAGKYLPAIGRAVLSHPDRTFNITSALIGNPLTDPANQAFSSVAMACGDGGYPAVLDEDTCTDLWSKVPRCEALLQACYSSGYWSLVCGAAELYCSQLAVPYLETGRNVYDISDVCGDDCYPEINYIEEYLRDPKVIEAVGSDIDDFVGCSSQVGFEFEFAMDEPKNEAPDVSEMLDAGIDVLVYDGAYDWICSWPGVYRFLERLPYADHAEFNDRHVKTWYVDGKPAGESKTAGHLTWLKVYGAGHMVPHDKGKQAAAMLTEWIKNREFVH